MQFAKFIGVALAAGLLSTSASAVTLKVTDYTTSDRGNVTVTGAPAGVPTGKKTATGFETEFGVEDFIAWCFDLQHVITKNTVYSTYVVTANPFSTSFLAAGAADRAQDLFDAVYAGVDAYDSVDATAFQMALWEVAYDDDFDLSTGDFTATTSIAGAAATASGYLSAASGYLGGQNYLVRFLENTENSQNLVTASPLPPVVGVPVPAAAPLLLGAFGAAFAIARRRKA